MKPIYCIETNPSRATISFGGELINLTLVCVKSGLAISYLSHILAGRRSPSLSTCGKISKALGITTADFVAHLEAYHTARHNAAA